jgi:hypothetical protein
MDISYEYIRGDMMCMLAWLKKYLKEAMPALYWRYQLMRESHEQKLLRKEIISYLFRSSKKQFQILAHYYNHHLLTAFPYEYVDNYQVANINVYHDKDGYGYVLHQGLKLFFKKSWTDEKIRSYYTGLLIEQDLQSPHCYLNSRIRYPGENDIVADIGAAEGIFSLDIIEHVKYLYLFECDEEWVIPLQKTFSLWNSKVQLVEKFVGNVTNTASVRLDDYFFNREIDFIKVDIEGAERLCIGGAEFCLKNKISKALFCAYHHVDDDVVLSHAIKAYGFQVDFNKGYMLFPLFEPNNLQVPYLRRGVFFASKKR